MRAAYFSSSPFKGEARWGMGCFLGRELMTHPHPNPEGWLCIASPFRRRRAMLCETPPSPPEGEGA